MAKKLVVSTILEVPYPLAKVWDFMSNPENATAWYKNIISSEWIEGNDTVRKGAKARFSAQFMGKRMDYVYEFSAVAPPVQLVMKTASGPFPMQTEYKLESTGMQSTRIELINEGEPRGFAFWLMPFMKMMMKAANKKDLLQLANCLSQLP